VLGNVHTPEAARVVTTQLGAEDPKVRSRAVEALRLAPTPGVDSMLTKALDDADPGVRASAAWSLGYRKPDADTMRAMTAKLNQEQDVAVVTKLLDVLWIRRASDRVAIVGAVERVAREHPSDKVRAYAQQLLDTAS
jgi:HEAT repeat protein